MMGRVPRAYDCTMVGRAPRAQRSLFSAVTQRPRPHTHLSAPASMVTLAPEEGDLEERIQFAEAMAEAGDESDDDEEDSDDEDDDGSALLRALLDEEGQPDPAIEASEFLVVSPDDARFLFSQGITYISNVSGWTLLHCLKRLALLVGCWPLLHYMLCFLSSLDF